MTLIHRLFYWRHSQKLWYVKLIANLNVSAALK